MTQYRKTSFMIFRHLIVALCIGVAGASLPLSLAMESAASNPMGLSLDPFALAMIPVSGLGAFVAGLICAPLFGHDAEWELGAAMLGAVLATALGGLFGALLAEGPMGFSQVLVFGMIFPFLLISEGPLALVSWLVTLTATHYVAKKLRRIGDGLERPTPGAFL